MPSNTVVYQIPGAISDLSIPQLPRDELLTGANSGVRFLFDLANAFCWTPGTPVQGKAVKDMAEISADGQVNTTGGTLAAAGNGIDFTNSSARACVSAPAGMLGDLYADQEYILCGYWKLPVIGSYPTGSGLNTSMLTGQAGDSDHYGISAEPVLMAWDMSVLGRLKVTRPVILGTAGAESINLSLTSHAGLLTQIAMWRTATNWNCRLKSSAGTTIGTANTTNVKSTGDFSAKGLHWGPSGSFGLPTNSARNGLRLYRGFAENTKRSGRSPITVLDDDYARTVARGVYS